MDQGIADVLIDETGKPIENHDAKDARSLSTYDAFNRPINGWSQNNASDTLRLTAHAIYGEAATNPKDDNLLGQLWQEYYESGKNQMEGFDFKGNLLSKQQQVISSATLKGSLDNYNTYLVDWTGLPSILGTQVFETSNEYDALNRPTKITLPEDVNTNRKEIVPTYNRAGALEKVSYDSTEYVKNIAYNAKGQRLLIAFGNDVMTRYVYSNTTFRLQRYRSEKYNYSQVGDTHTYTKQPGTNRQDEGFDFDLVGNIMKLLIRVNDCGISGSILGSNKLDREFEYDPLYRVTSADGRESDTQNNNDYLYSDAPAPGTPNATNVRAYERQYSYDKLGNIQKVIQTGTNGFTRDFSYFTGQNTLEKVEDATPAVIQSFTYDNMGNQITAGSNRNYKWNAANQLITYYNQAGGSDPTIYAQYDYDGGGNRVSKLLRTGTAASPIYERTVYIDGVFEYHILENGTTYEKNYVHVMDDKSRIAMVRIGDQFPDDISDSVTYNLEDQIGSSSMRLNTSGGVIDKEEYYPFGDSSLRTFSKKRYRYVGKEKDLESGLYYYGARYYAAWTCRFISVDPLAADYPFYAPYNYAGNKPVNKIDIDGKQEEGAQSVELGNSQPNVENKENNNSEILHKVKEGDTLSEISEKYNVSQQAIIDANSSEGGVWDTKDRSKNWVYSGETLIIPNKTVDSEFMKGDVITLNEGEITIDKFGFSPDKDLPLINIEFTFSPSSQEVLNQDTSNYRWIQTFSTNEDYNSNYKYHYPPYEGNFSKNIMDISDRQGNSSMINYNEDGMTIHDVLGRLSRSNYSVYWQAETSLVKVDSEGNASVLYTLTWGFTIDKNGSGWSTGLNSVSNPSDFHLRMIQINQSNLDYREPK